MDPSESSRGRKRGQEIFFYADATLQVPSVWEVGEKEQLA